MNCLQCTHLDLQAYRDHARVGLGRCALQSLPGVFESFTVERDCKKFAAAAPDQVSVRTEWWAKHEKARAELAQTFREGRK